MMKKLDLKDLTNYHEPAIICLGFFDGFHLGHQKMIEELVLNSKKYNYKSVVITFLNTSLKHFKHSNQLISLKDKLKIFQKYGVDEVLVLKNKDHIFTLSAKSFINKVLLKLNTKMIVCGQDIHFGKNQEGDLKYLQENTDYKLLIIPKLLINNQVLSSSYIRDLLTSGKIKEANELLYQPFFIYSKVIKGKQIGRTIDFKTANLKITLNSYLLKHGVYVGKVSILKKQYKAMINVGYNPTVSQEKKLKIEVHILNFNENLYGKFIKVEFLSYLRQEISFSSLEGLKQQLIQDLNKIKQYNFS